MPSFEWPARIPPSLPSSTKPLSCFHSPNASPGVSRAVLLGTFAVACLSAATAPAAAAAPLNVYSIGNSLTVDLRANGGVEFLSRNEARPISHDYHPRCGSSLTGIVANITQTCVPSFAFGTFSEAFSPAAPWSIDVVTLQPFYGPTIRQEVAAARSLIETIRASDAGRDSRILIYATWPSQSDGPLLQAWAREDITLDSPFRPSRKSYDLFLDAVQEFEPNAALVPAGHAWVAVAEELTSRGAFNGISAITDLYRDDIHASNLGRYVAGLAAYATIYEKSPVGVGSGWMYSINGYGPAPQSNDLSRLQEATYRTVQAVPEPGFASVLCATAALALALRSLRKRNSLIFRVHPGFPWVVWAVQRPVTPGGLDCVRRRSLSASSRTA